MSQSKQFIRTCELPCLEVRQLDQSNEAVTLTGYASVFDTWTTLKSTPREEVREIVRKGAFARDLASSTDIRALYNHDTGQVFGRVSNGTLRLSEDDNGLRVEIDLPSTSLGRDVEALVKRGDISGMSFAFIPRPNGEITRTRTEGSKSITESELTDLQLIEVSITPFPAYPSTSIALLSRSEAIIDSFKAESKARWSKINAIKQR